jgi:hypothetical protein
LCHRLLLFYYHLLLLLLLLLHVFTCSIVSPCLPRLQAVEFPDNPYLCDSVALPLESESKATTSTIINGTGRRMTQMLVVVVLLLLLRL